MCDGAKGSGNEAYLEASLDDSVPTFVLREQLTSTKGL